MGKKKNKNRALQPQPDQATANPPPQQPGNENASNIILPGEQAQTQQDSWRSYNDGTNNLQTATDFQSFYQSHPTFFRNSQQQVYPSVPRGLNASSWLSPIRQEPQAYSPQPLGHQAYASVPQVMNTATFPLRPFTQNEHSHFKPFQPLRVSDGMHESQVLQQAINPSQKAPQSPTKDPRRYKPRQGKKEQNVPVSGCAADNVLPSVERKQYTGVAGRIVPLFERSRNSPHREQSPRVRPPTTPTPSIGYKRNAELDPVLRGTSTRLLVILDLNGTLLVRPNKRRPTHFIVRPGVGGFLDYLFRNHVVMVYSSAKPHNCAAMVQQFFRPDQSSLLAAVWARDKLGLTPAQYDAKVQVYKKLEPIWQDKDIQRRAGPDRVWDQTNTVLVDDSKLKALSQPHNLLQIPEFLNNEPTSMQERLDWWRNEDAIVQSVQQKLEELKWQVDVSRLIREWQTGKRQAPGVVDETVDQKALQTTEGGAQSPTPTPSVSDREVSYDPEQSQTPGASPMSTVEQYLPQYKPIETESEGVSSGEEGGVTLDDLEKDINRNLSLTQHSPDSIVRQNPLRQNAGAALAAGSAVTTDRAQGRSESPASQEILTDPRIRQPVQGKEEMSKASCEEGTQKRKKGKRAGRDGETCTTQVNQKTSSELEGAPMTPESLGA